MLAETVCFRILLQHFQILYHELCIYSRKKLPSGIILFRSSLNKKGSVLFVFICLISMLGLLQLFQQIFQIDVNA